MPSPFQIFAIPIIFAYIFGFMGCFLRCILISNKHNPRHPKPVL